MKRRNNNFQQLTVTYFLLLVITFSIDSILTAQEIERNPREIIIGDLVGRTDYQDLQILTKQGLLPITGEGNGKPFSVLQRTPTNVVVQFYRSSGIGDFSPNRVVYRFFDNERALISALILNEVDVAVLESETSAMEVKKSNTDFLPLPLQAEKNRVKLVLYNHRNQLFSSIAARQAISYGINHDYIIKKIIKDGKATLARGPFDDNSKFYNSGMKTYKYNPRFALQLLGQFGWRDSNRDGIIEKNGKMFRFKLFYPKGGRLDEAISRIIKIDLIKLGIDVTPQPLTRREINSRLASGDFDAVLLDHTFSDGIESLSQVFGKNGDLNFSGYYSRIFERYLRFYHTSATDSRKKTLIKSMQGVLNEDQPATFLYFKWVTHYMVNISRYRDFRYTDGPNRGQIKPFEEWELNKVLYK